MSADPIKIERILVPTDFSSHALSALAKGVAIAQACQAELTVAHILTDMRSAMADMSYESRWELVAGDIDKFQQALRRNSDAKLTELVKQFEGQTHVQVATLIGTPFVEIIRTAQEKPFDLVMVGTRGVSALRRLVLGSTTERLIRHCPAAVWAVQAETAGAPKTILAVTDFSEASARAMQTAAAVAKCTSAELHALHVVEHEEILPSVDVAGEEVLQISKRKVNSSVKRMLAEFARTHAGELPADRQRITWGKPWKSISDTAKRLKADLVVLGTVGRSGIPGLLLGNTAEKVLHTVTCDVLAVKPAGFVTSIEPAVRVS